MALPPALAKYQASKKKSPLGGGSPAHVDKKKHKSLAMNLLKRVDPKTGKPDDVNGKEPKSDGGGPADDILMSEFKKIHNKGVKKPPTPPLD